MRTAWQGAALLALGLAAAAWTTPVRASSMLDDDPATCMALALYWEARAEGRDGMRAVASVILNRVEHPQFPDEVCAVVKQGGETPPCQFSWWCDGRSDVPTEAQAWREAQTIADEALEQRFSDGTGGALFFHTSSMREPWRIRRVRTVQIGEHVFYR